MDLIDGSALWLGLPQVIPPPPPPPPVSDADGVMVPGMFPDQLYSAGHYTRINPVTERANPWRDMILWLRRLRRIDREWEISELARKIELDDLDLMELTVLSRSRL